MPHRHEIHPMAGPSKVTRHTAAQMHAPLIRRGNSWDNMSTVYRKSDKGQVEIETRALRLAPRLRTALILVDGRRNDAELSTLIGSEAPAILQTLLDQGFVDVASVAADPPSRTAPAVPATATAPSPASGTDTKAFEKRRREAVRHLIEQIGPMADTVAIRMEKSSDWGELRSALQVAQQVLRNTRGAGAATDYAIRFIDTPP
jgi:hypothetical protein